eukprot:1673211-Rhodomonas_salina.2
MVDSEHGCSGAPRSNSRATPALEDREDGAVGSAVGDETGLHGRERVGHGAFVRPVLPAATRDVDQPQRHPHQLLNTAHQPRQLQTSASAKPVSDIAEAEAGSHTCTSGSRGISAGCIPASSKQTLETRCMT